MSTCNCEHQDRHANCCKLKRVESRVADLCDDVRRLERWLKDERDRVVQLRAALSALVETCERDGGYTPERDVEMRLDLGDAEADARQPWKALREAREAMARANSSSSGP